MNLRSAELGVLKLSVTVDEDKLIEGALKVLAAIRPTWIEDNIKFKVYSRNLDKSVFRIFLAVILPYGEATLDIGMEEFLRTMNEVFTDGITNKLLGCFYADAPDDVILVRAYGRKTDLLIDRNAETRNIQLLHAFGYAPNLYATFTNGLAYEYVPGEILMEDTCLDPQVFPLVAVMMANMHRVDCGPDVPKEPCMWTKTCQFMNIMPDKFSDVEKHARFVKLIPNRQKLQQEYELLKSELMDLGSPVVFSHNDLLLGNIIYNSKKECVTFIDYEYANYNYQAFDIGNHFAEFAGVSEVDYSRYPSPEFQRQWLRIYLEAYLNPPDASEKNESLEVTEYDIDVLYVQVNKFCLMAHFFWAIWALIQAEHSTIDFDFLGYAATRLEEYFARKDQFLSLKMPNL